MQNEDVADRLDEIADLLETQDVAYKPRAYRTAARNVETLSADVEDLHEEGRLQDIDGVGESIAEKIAEYLDTGELEYLQELRAEADFDVEALTAVRGIGPKTAYKLYREAGIADLDDLERAARAGDIRTLEGFGEKTEQNILDHIELARRGQERTLLGRAESRAEEIHDRLADADEFDRVQIVGSFRRRRPTVGDIDVLATAPDPAAAMDRFTGFEAVEDVRSRGETKSSVVVPGDLQVDLRIVDPECWGAALVYFTGSKDHNITLRDRALDRDWKLNEYGLYDVSGVEDAGEREGDRIAGDTEEGVYDALDCAWIPPELREDTGEVEAAANDALPDLVTADDVRGDLQVHTDYSDGSNTVAEMAAAADDRGHDYLLVTDHGPALDVTGGVDAETLPEQADEIADANDECDVTVLHGVEANVTADGLDVSHEWCERLDFVVAAMHEAPENPTDRLVGALESHPVDVLAHPLNRKINERDPLDFDRERLVETAAEQNVALEINAQPDRLDLPWAAVKTFRDDVDFVVSTDAHGTAELDFLHLGVAQAQRGWLEPADVLNTRSLSELRDALGE
ncbi:MAG: DNA polymerase/3'-5' exonuclease PolX [Halobacteriaceae archaeon]